MASFSCSLTLRIPVANPGLRMLLADVQVGHVLGHGALGEVVLGIYQGVQMALIEPYLKNELTRFPRNVGFEIRNPG